MQDNENIIEDKNINLKDNIEENTNKKEQLNIKDNKNENKD